MDFTIRKASPSEYDQIITIIQNTLDTISNKEWFVADNEEYIRCIFEHKKGTPYVAIHNESLEIAGIFLTMIPEDSPENLGLDVNLPAKELHKVVHMESVSVLPAYRGHKLQRRLMEFAENDLKSTGHYYLFCTIHPDNKYSMNNALSLDYQVMKVCEKYGGYLRAILMKEIGI